MSRQHRPPKEPNRDRTAEVDRRKEESDAHREMGHSPDQGSRGDERSQRHDRMANRRTEPDEDEEW